MAEMRTLQRSFAGGEMSPSMHARVDDVRFQNGYASARNYEVLPDGSLRRRPGLRHVRRCKHNDKRCRLIPFTFSVDQTMQIEMGHQYFRFHQNGGTLHYGTPLTIESVSAANDTIRFTTPHARPNNTAVVFTASAGGTIPGGLVEGTVYYVINDSANTDTKTIQVSATIGPGAAFNIDATAGVGTSRMFLASELSTRYFVSRNFATTDVSLALNEIDLTTAHNLTTGDPIRFTTTGTFMRYNPGSGPSLDLTEGYVIVVSPTVISVSLTPGGPEVDIDFTGTGTHRIHRFYPQGFMVYWIGTGHGVFYARADVTSDAAGAPPADTAHWYLEPDDGVYEVPGPFIEADLPAVTYDQSNDVITLAHKSYALSELRREGALTWVVGTVAFAPQLSAPTISSVTRTFGTYQEFTANSASPTIFTTLSTNFNGHGLQVADSVYVEAQSGGIGGGASFNGNAAGYYEVMDVRNGTAGLPANEVKLRTVAGGSPINGVSVNVFMRYASLNSDTTQRYKVTAATSDGLESQPSAYAEAINNLSVPGSANTIAFSAVTGAAEYRIYKEQDATYGFIGRCDAGVLTFKDENIAPDLGRSLATLDTSLGTGTGNHPAAVTHYEQRRVLGGTTNVPNGVWSTRSGTESDLSFHIPVLDDDRLKFEVANNEAVSIRHLVPWKQLIVLTNSAEFRVVPVNSEALTPNSIDSKNHSYQGCSIVRPTVANSNLVFCAARGGHVFEMGYLQQGGLSDPGDLCFRSSHLFNGQTIEDQAYAKAPHPTLWFCSPGSELSLGLTYVPQEQIGAWHAHDTAADGVFESCGVIAEGDEDARYFVVRRTINGSVVRSIEVMSTELFDDITDAFFVDAGGSFNGTDTDGTTMTVTGGVTWGYGEAVTITAFHTEFVLGSDDVGDHIVLLASDGTKYAIRITSVTTSKIATGTLLAALPVALRSTPVATWAFARDTIKGLDHLEGQTVQVLGDGLVQATRVVASGSITLATPAIKGCVGLGMPSPCTLLPIGLQVIEAFGQGRTKNVNQAALRVVSSGPFLIGPNSGNPDDLVPANSEAVPGSLVTGEARVTLMPEWSAGGQITLRIDDPLPLTLLGIVMQVSIGD